MNRTLDELFAAVNTIVGEDNTDDDVLALIEDLTDTLTEAAPAEPDSDLTAEIERLTGELDAMKKRYKDRFFGRGEDDPEEEVEEEVEEEKPDGLTITTKDIFKDKED